MKRGVLLLLFVLLSSYAMAACYDTDGSDLFTKGTVTDAAGNYTDTCNSGFIIEYICKDGAHGRTAQKCDEGCDDGACIGGVPKLEIELPPEPTPIINTVHTFRHTGTIESNITRTFMKVKDLIRLDVTDEEIEAIGEYIAQGINEDNGQLIEDLKDARDEGTMASALLQISSRHPLRYKLTTFFRMNHKDWYSELEGWKRINPDFLEKDAAILEQKISFNDLFKKSASNPYLSSESGEIKLVSDTSDKVAFSIKHTDGFPLGTLEVEKGSAKTIFTSSKERVLVKTKDNQLTNLRTQVQVGITNPSKDSGLKLTTLGSIDNELSRRFETVAKENGLQLLDRIGAMIVETYNINESTAVISFTIEKPVLGLASPDSLRIFRATGTETELLNTSGIAKSGLDITIEAESDGLSVFALYVTDKAKKDLHIWAHVKKFGLYILLAITLAAALYYSIRFGIKVKRRRRYGKHHS